MKALFIVFSIFLLSCSPRLPAPSAPAAPETESRLSPILELVESVPDETTWDQPDLREAREVWPQMIGRARRTLDIAQFYIAHREGEALEPVLAAVEAAARRGVRVRVLVDQKMMRETAPVLDRLGALPGLATAVYDLSGSTGGVLHAKYFIVDDREAFVGSQNFDWRALRHIHELGLRIEDPEVLRTLRRLFEMDFARARGDAPPSSNLPDRDRDGLPDGEDPRPAAPTWSPRPGSEVPLLYLVASPPALNPPGVPEAEKHLVRLLDGARSSISVQLLNYSVVLYGGGSWDIIDKALRRAAARGVRVRLNLSHWCKASPKIDALKALANVPGLEVKLNTIPPHSSGHIPYARVDHSKYMVIDGEVGWLGTSNWSGDYFTASRNVELVFRAPKIVAAMSRIFEQGWLGPYVENLDPEKIYEKPKIN